MIADHLSRLEKTTEEEKGSEIVVKTKLYDMISACQTSGATTKKFFQSLTTAPKTCWDRFSYT